MSDSKYDVVVIGSGLGGLVSADILSRNGFRTAVFEKHSVAGGCLQTFARGGVRFETGMHYIGSLDRRSVLGRYFRYLGIADDIPLSRLDPAAYERITIGGEEYRYASGYDNFIGTLSASFPACKDDLRRYADLCSSVTQSSPMYSFCDSGEREILKSEYVSTAASSAIDGITDNARLRQVLGAICPLYGGVRGMTPLYIHALIWDFYNKGAYRVVGGSDAIARALCNRIRQAGGEIFTDSEVLAVNCSATEAVSVTVKGRGAVETKYIISDIHPQALIGLVDSSLLRKVYRERIQSMEQTVSNFSVYMTFKPETVPYINSNCFHYEDDVWDCRTYSPGLEDWPRNFLYMHQCAEKDQKFATHAIAFAYMNWKDVERWSATSVGRRGEEYEAFKEMCAERLLAAVEAQFPGTRRSIDKVWTSSPLTYRDYTGTEGGSMYGILHDASRMSQTTLAQRTKIPNLFLAGQSINSHGILGVTIGAVLACSQILGYDNLMNKIKEETK